MKTAASHTHAPAKAAPGGSTGFASAYANSDDVPRCRSCEGALEEDAGDHLADQMCDFCFEKQRRAKAYLASIPAAAPSSAFTGAVAEVPDPFAGISVPTGHILLGLESGDAPLTLDLRRLVAGRCLVQGFSGAGKSKLLRRIVEQAHSFTTMVLLDIEGEFGNLAEHIGAVTVKAADLATDGLTALALRTRHHRIPIHLDLTDLEPDTRIAKASAFLSGLLSCPRAIWKNTVMVVVDEAHLLAPQVAATSRDAELRRLGVATLTDLCSRGRKRGICPVIATQRLAKLAASVRSELQNVLIGLNVLDRDIATARDMLGFTMDKANLLRELHPGQFVAFGPALSRTPRFVQIGETITEHLGATPELLPSAGYDRETAKKLLQIDALKDVSGAQASPKAAQGGGGRGILDNFLLEPSAALATRVVGALTPISPNAATLSDLSRHLAVESDKVHDAIDLLAKLGAVDTMPRSEDRIVRLSARIRIRVNGAQVVGLA